MRPETDTGESSVLHQMFDWNRDYLPRQRNSQEAPPLALQCPQLWRVSVVSE